MAPRVEPYGFDPSLERVIVLLACTRSSFWGRIGRVLDPEAISDQVARFALTACKAIAAETGNGPASDRQVIQRLRFLKHKGSVTQEQIDQVEDLLDRAEEERGSWPEEAAVVEAQKILQPRLQQAALIKGMHSWSARDDLLPIAEEIVQASRVGSSDMSLGTIWGPEAIVPAYSENSLATGIHLLDDALGGGTFRKELCVVAGDTGSGKSQFMAQVIVEAMFQHKMAAYLTTEVGTNVISRRLAANITGVPYDSIKRGEAVEQAREIVRRKDVEFPIIKELAQNTTTVPEIIAWLKHAESVLKKPIDLLVIDMADHLAAPKAKDTYTGMGSVYAALRELAKDHDKWVWTASHTKERKDKSKVITPEQLSDSRHKGRTCDTLVTLLYHEDTKDIDFYLAKGRDIEGARMIGSLPSDFATSMIVRVDRVGRGERAPS